MNAWRGNTSSMTLSDEVVLIEMSAADTVILLHQHLDWHLNVRIQNNKPLLAHCTAMAVYGKFLGCFSQLFICFPKPGKTQTRTIPLS